MSRKFEYMICPTCGAQGKLGYVPQGGDGSALRIIPHRDKRQGTNHTCPAGNTMVNRVEPAHE